MCFVCLDSALCVYMCAHGIFQVGYPGTKAAWVDGAFRELHPESFPQPCQVSIDHPPFCLMEMLFNLWVVGQKAET